MKQVYIKEQVCMGCHLCEVYCLQKYARSKDLVKAYKKESPRALPRVRVDESGIVSLSVRCQHCADAPCIRACLTGALYRDPATALVTVDEERCIDCGNIPEYQLGKEVGIAELDDKDLDVLDKYVTEFAAIFGYNAKQLTNQAFIKLYPRFLRPYGRLYAY
jgi:ferredoxin